MAQPSPKSKSPEELEQMETQVNRTSKRKVTLKQVEMDTVMVKNAVNITNEVMDVTQRESEIAGALKVKFDQQYRGPWQCIVGRKFGSRITHDAGYFLYMIMDNQAIMLFKTYTPEKMP